MYHGAEKIFDKARRQANREANAQWEAENAALLAKLATKDGKLVTSGSPVATSQAQSR